MTRARAPGSVGRMKHLRSLVFGVLVLAPACDSGDGDSGGEGGGRVDTILAIDGDATAGQTVFTSTCALAACHGADGNTPGTAEAKRLSEEIPALDDAMTVSVIIEGYETMPAQSLSDQQVADVLAYVNETFG